ncbi:acyltransferase family protein [Neptunicella sp. SCSIO 80796]|uniref:acyltransferase family protein n=1 Tax=Neptunicella plasticusilytica TaxID=3117012 RepID=UPI003A4DCEFF
MQQNPKKQRVAAIDVLRGLTIALMILVNTPGSWSHVYWPFLHADWSGATPTDMVFPFFIFIVGAAMSYSLSAAVQAGIVPWGKIAKRALLLFVIGLVLNIFPFDSSPDEWRILGVLQRIALCYLFGAILILTLSVRSLIICSAGLLLGYWLVMALGSAQPYGLETNLVRQIDLALLGANHLWQGKGLPFDPEGLLSTIPAIVTLLCGYLTSLWLQNIDGFGKQIRSLIILAAILIVVACLWHQVHPINKSLWTGSFVLLTAGVAMAVLALIIWMWEAKGWRFGLETLRIYGSNPLVVYVGSGLLAVTLSELIEMNFDGQTVSAYQYGFMFLNQYMSAKNASLLFALIIVSLFYALAHFLYRKKWFVKL